jgi:hypothetical protein
MMGFFLSTALLAVVEPTATSGVEVEVKVTQKYLVPVCLDDALLKPGQSDRHWRLTASEHTFIFTMRNEPRHAAVPEVSPGFAVVRFTPEAGHRYEVEVRAAETSFSTRAWKQGEWKPVIRDRTSEAIVSSDPEWSEAPCR